MPAWLGGFVNPALLAGVSLAAVPVIIHLLNRQRHRPVPWAAMRFVLAAYRKTRRRVQLENLILLLLRVAAVLLLALAIARPFTGLLGPLAALTESRRGVVLVLDASASTGYREDVQTVFERIVDRARATVRELDGGRGDRVRLIAASSYPRLLSWTTPDKALSMLDTLSAPSDDPLDLAAALAQVNELATEDAAGTGRSTLEVRFLTDLQARSFALGEPAPDGGAASPSEPAAPAGAATAQPDAHPGESRPALVEQLDALAALGLTVIVEDLGPALSVPPNLGIASVQPLEAAIAPGSTVEVRVEVLNHGPTAKSGARVVLYVDGERRPNQPLDVPARGRAEAVFPVVFPAAGEHVLRAELDGDRLPIDDARSEVVLVPPPVRVLLVNGAPSSRIDEDEIGYLAAVLEPIPDDGRSALAPAPFEPKAIGVSDLGGAEEEIASHDVVWLANVESVPPHVVRALEKRVAAGGALIVSAGDRVDPDSTNQRLFRADGSGLLPAELGARVSVPDRRKGYFRVGQFAADHPALVFFAEDRWKPLLTEVPVYEFLAARPIDGARVLASLDDDGAHPLLVERAYDRGRVFLWTSSIDPAWTRLPESPRTLVPLVHELLRYAARTEPPPRNVAPGEPLLAEVEGFPRGLVLVRPDATRRTLDEVPEEVAAGRYRLPAISGKDTERIGLYRIETEAKRAQTISFSVQLDPREGDLERISPAELGALHPALALVAPGDDDRGSSEGLPPARGELWRALALGCLVALVLESLWAAWIGQRRRIAR